MIRLILAAMAAIVLPLSSLAGETVVRLTVRPAQAPQPAFKYQLLPDVRELNPGNAAQNYLKCFAEQRYFYFDKKAVAERIRYLTVPLAELPVDKLLNYGGSSLKQADWAARLDGCDWQVLHRVQTEGKDAPQQELALIQLLPSALKVRFRGEVAADRFDAAVVTAKTMFALSRHLGEFPAESANVLGLSTALLAVDVLDEMVQRPGCPNLYWALTDLPCPLVELRKGLQGDRSMVTTDLRPLRADSPMTADELEKLVRRISGMTGFAREQAGQPPRSLRSGLAVRLKDDERVRTARTRLIAHGIAAELVQRFPPTQVILLDEKHHYERRRDDAMKLLALPCWQVDGSLQGGTAEEQGLFDDLLPQVKCDRRLQARLEQRIALLRQVEALQLYAADHDGGLPDSLAQLAVPLPLDPFTGKPFVYKLEGTTAQLHGSPPRGEEQTACFNVRYEVTIKK